MFSRRLGYAPSWQVMISTPSLSACSISFPALSQSVKDLILLAVFGPIPGTTCSVWIEAEKTPLGVENASSSVRKPTQPTSSTVRSAIQYFNDSRSMVRVCPIFSADPETIPAGLPKKRA